MKIKCPSCQTLLQVPDSAAGKVVKCTCGKQMRLPAPTGTQSTVPVAPGAPVAKPTVRPTGAQPRPVAGGQGLDPSVFDELTTDDMKPIRDAYAPPAVVSTAHAGNAALRQYAGNDGSNAARPGKRPGTLTFLGVVNGVWSGIYVLGVLVLFGITAIAADEIAEDAEATAVWGLLLGAAIAMTVGSIAIAVSCFIPKPACWYVVTFGYAFFFADRIMGIVGDFRGDDPNYGRIGGACVGVVVGALFWAYLHGDEVRAFYRVQASSLKFAAIADVLGLLVGFGLGAAVVFNS